VRSRSEAYVERLLATDHFNVAADLGIPLTREVTLYLMGVVDPPTEINRWSDDLIFQSPTAAESGAKLMQFLLDEINERRANPREDFMTGLVQAEMNGRPLSDDEIQRISLLVLTAGLETTNSAISGAVWYLVQNAEAAQELSAGNDELWRLAMDEFVRWTSPAPAESRTVTRDLEFEGCPMRQNERLMLLYGSANRDAAEFPDPDSVILDRRPNRHVAFGMGPHRCLGSHLAKLEMQCVLKALAPALGEWKLDDDNPVVWQGAEVRGIRSLPIVRR
jgi:cytochrome P450